MRGGGYVDDEGTTRTDTDDMYGFRSHVVNLRAYLALGANNPLCWWDVSNGSRKEAKVLHVQPKPSCHNLNFSEPLYHLHRLTFPGRLDATGRRDSPRNYSWQGPWLNQGSFLV